MHEENKLIVVGSVEHQAANESLSSDSLDRNQNDKRRVEKNYRIIGISIVIQGAFCLGKHSSKSAKERPLVIMIANQWNYRVLMISSNKLKEKKCICRKIFL